MTEDDIRSLLREMKDDPIPGDSVARVRMGVAESTGAKRIIWWRVFPAVAVACAVLIAIVLPRPSDRPGAPAVTVKSPSPALAVAASVAVPASRPAQLPSRLGAASIKQRIRRVEPQALQRAAHGVDAVRIETADPDVVIVLLGD